MATSKSSGTSDPAKLPRRVQVRFALAGGGIANRVYRVVDEPERFTNHDEPHLSPAEMGAVLTSLADAGRLISAGIVEVDRDPPAPSLVGIEPCQVPGIWDGLRESLRANPDLPVALGLIFAAGVVAVLIASGLSGVPA